MPRPIDPQTYFDWLVGDRLPEGLMAVRYFTRTLAEHERRHVQAARAHGWPWHVISAYLCLLPQTLHKRWARRLDD